MEFILTLSVMALVFCVAVVYGITNCMLPIKGGGIYMGNKKCDCGAEPYYDEPIAQGVVLCESCYVGELEATSMACVSIMKKMKELRYGWQVLATLYHGDRGAAYQDVVDDLGDLFT